MLYREIIAVCSEIHTKHINKLCGQNVELLNVKLAVHEHSCLKGSRIKVGGVVGVGSIEMSRYLVSESKYKKSVIQHDTAPVLPSSSGPNIRLHVSLINHSHSFKNFPQTFLPISSLQKARSNLLHFTVLYVTAGFRREVDDNCFRPYTNCARPYINCARPYINSYRYSRFSFLILEP